MHAVQHKSNMSMYDVHISMTSVVEYYYGGVYKVKFDDFLNLFYFVKNDPIFVGSAFP